MDSAQARRRLGAAPARAPLGRLGRHPHARSSSRHPHVDELVASGGSGHGWIGVCPGQGPRPSFRHPQAAAGPHPAALGADFPPKASKNIFETWPTACGCRKLRRAWSGCISVVVDEPVASGVSGYGWAGVCPGQRPRPSFRHPHPDRTALRSVSTRSPSLHRELRQSTFSLVTATDYFSAPSGWCLP